MSVYMCVLCVPFLWARGCPGFATAATAATSVCFSLMEKCLAHLVRLARFRASCLMCAVCLCFVFGIGVCVWLCRLVPCACALEYTCMLDTCLPLSYMVPRVPHICDSFCNCTAKIEAIQAVRVFRVFRIFVEAHGCVFRLVHVNAHVSEILVESKLIAVRSPQLSSLYMYMYMYMHMYPYMYGFSI